MNWYKSNNSADGLDNTVFLQIYEKWKSERGKALRLFYEKCDGYFASNEAVRDYDKSVYVHIRDDTARLSVKIESEKAFTHWFAEEPLISKSIQETLRADDSENEHISRFIDEMQTLQGAKTLDNVSYGYINSLNRRASILWSCALCVVAEAYTYGDYDDSIASVITTLKNTVSGNIVGSGYKTLDTENVLDAYIAYSVCRGVHRINRSQLHKE